MMQIVVLYGNCARHIVNALKPYIWSFGHLLPFGLFTAPNDISQIIGLVIF